MEDYIFLIIAVVISIFAAINKNKKKEIIGSTIVEKEEEPGNYFMDRLFHVNSFVEEEEPIPTKIIPALKKEPLIAPAPLRPWMNQQMPFKSSLPDRSEKKIQSSLKKETGLINNEDETEPIESIGYLEDFSLRKAFVYSEIINPKYLQETGS